MSKKLMGLVTAALKKAKVEITDEVKEILSDALESSSLEGAGLVELSPGHKLVEESVYTELIADNKKYRKRSQDAEAERDRLKSTLDAGDSENKQRADRFEKRNKELEPRVEKWEARDRKIWTERAKRIPEAKADAKDEEKDRVEWIRGHFVFPEKDQELTADQLLSNLDAYDGLVKGRILEGSSSNAGAPGDGGGSPPPAPRGNGGGGSAGPVDLNAAYKNFYKDPMAPQGNAR